MIVYVGIPCMDGRVLAPLVDSLLAEQLLALKGGVHLIIDWEIGCSLVHVARNRIASRFLASPLSDTLVFVDSDMSWTGGDLVKLARRPESVIGGTYRTKQAEPVHFHVRPPVTWEGDVLRVDGLPTGFLKISREALLKLDATPYTHGEGETHWDFFPTGVRDGEMWGEDYGFCRLCADRGVPIYLDPSLKLRHHDGMQKFEGDVIEWLKSSSGAADAGTKSSPSPDGSTGQTS